MAWKSKAGELMYLGNMRTVRIRWMTLGGESHRETGNVGCCLGAEDLGFSAHSCDTYLEIAKIILAVEGYCHFHGKTQLTGGHLTLSSTTWPFSCVPWSLTFLSSCRFSKPSLWSNCEKEQRDRRPDRWWGGCSVGQMTIVNVTMFPTDVRTTEGL